VPALWEYPALIPGAYERCRTEPPHI
jgi:hypothetical protein